MQREKLHVWGILAAALAFQAAASASTPAPLLRPRLSTGPAAAGSQVVVEVADEAGAVRRSILRTSPAAVTPGRTGWDPARRTAFVTWTEDGERWFSASRDSGATWFEPRPIETGLRLHAGEVLPGRPLPPVPAQLELPRDGRLFLVQLATLSLPEWRDALAAQGAEVLTYFPHNAYVVRMSPALAAQVANLDIVERVEPYHPYFRIEDALREWMGNPGTGPGRMRVRVQALEWGPEGKGRILQAAEAEGARVALYYPSGHILELWVDREQLRQVAAHDDVLWIDRWSAPEKDMDLVRQDDGAAFLDTSFNVCGQGVRGEVLDAGFEATHMDFDGILLHGSNTTDSHGTSTYGIVFGNGNRDGDGNAQGQGQVVCSAQGIAADYDFLTDRFAHTQQLKAAPYFASFQSNSWGDSLTTAYTSISNQLDDIVWRLDIAIAQSQSNAGSQLSRPQAWAKNVISVGGIRHFNTLSTADDSWTNGASIGPAADGRLKPDVSYWYDSIFTTTTGNGYTTGFGGTSAATPEVAGVIGLIVQQWSDNVWGTNPVGTTVFERQPHASTIKALLINSSQQYPFTGTASDLTRTHQGWGRPNARMARERAAGSLVVDQGTPLELNQAATYNYAVPAGAGDLRITMAYPDPPGTTSATLHRINDLSLKVTSPGGTVYQGNNGLAAGNFSTPGGSPNSVDTVENVIVNAPAEGTWVIEVRAAAINQDAHLATPAADAVFSLVATAGGTAPPPFCGNNLIEGEEVCDGTALNGQTCATQGFLTGTLACNGNCSGFVTTACSSGPAPAVTAVAPLSGPSAGGTAVTVTGTNFTNGDTLTFGTGGDAAAATGVVVVNSTTITAVSPAHATGTVRATVTHRDNQSGFKDGAFFYFPASAGAGFYTVTPCRMVDTRNAAGPRGGPALVANSPRTFALTGFCGVPAGATALSVNVTVVAGAGSGSFSFYPGNAFPFGTNNLNFPSRANRAGASVLLLSTDGSGTVVVRNESGVANHLILDVNGYFQ